MQALIRLFLTGHLIIRCLFGVFVREKSISTVTPTCALVESVREDGRAKQRIIKNLEPGRDAVVHSA